MIAAAAAPPRIGLVIPSFNQGRYLAQALDSIFGQGYPALDVVVMDGGSTDETVDVIRSFEKRLTFWKSAPDAGQAAAVNEGATHCRGELLAWLNADDFYLDRSLWTVARAHQARPGAGLYIGNGMRYDQQEARYMPFCRRHLALNRRALTEGLDYVLQPATFFSRKAWDEVEGLRAALHYCMDWDIILRIARRHPAVLINEFLAASREHDETKTRRGKLPRVFEIVRMIRDHSEGQITAGGLHYLFEALLESGDALPSGARRHLVSAFASVHERFQREFGNADGFPEKGDPQDTVFMPLVGSSKLSALEPAEKSPLPSISLVMPSFQHARFLGRAIDSVLGQGYPGLELLVFDGGSTDGSVELLRGYEGRLTRWVSQPDRGPAHAINKGFAAATGEVLGWLNSDDMLAEGALLAAGRAFAEDPELDMVIGNALYVDEADQLYLADHGTHRTGLYYGEVQPLGRIPAYWAYVHAVPQPTVLFRRRLLDACGTLNESYHYIFDFELFFRFAAKAKMRKLERTQAFYRIHTAGKTSDWWRFEVELYRFSRRLWPRPPSAEFLTTWRDFVVHYLRRHFGRGPSDRRLWPIAALAALSSLTGVGNPESWSRAWRHPRT
ncbi:MAG TPA: glycosyltransferase family 2 protein [Vicinamibacteria bacterium]|jgi:glycosyltransferase involved in cell wall biosynthesis